MKVDTHNHTYYSPDGAQSPEDLAAAAIKNGVGVLCVTEHLDNGYPTYDDERFDCRITKQYFEDFGALKKRYAGSLEIIIGVEAGWTRENDKKNAKDLKKFPYEYVINSVHIVDGDDVYRPEFFAAHGHRGSYEAYLNAVYGSLFASYDYDAVGHLGYVARYANFMDNRLLYKDYSDKLDRILSIIIEKGKVLEVNSSTGKSGSLTMPDVSVLERYYSLGGRKIAFGSDSHYTSRFLYNYNETAATVKDIGFDKWTVKLNGKFTEVDI